METTTVPGCCRLIEVLDDAVAGVSAPEAITARVQARLAQLILDAGVSLPEELVRPVANACPEASVTLHVYGGELTSCNAFLPTADGWYERRRRELTYDA